MPTNNDPVWAFPRQPHYYVKNQTQHFYEGSYGMSLRDYFAAKALPAAVTVFMDRGNAWDDYDDLASSVWKIADAMLAERAK